MGGYFVIIALGVLRITGESSSGAKKELVLCEGDYIGEVSGMTGETEMAELEALTDVTLLEFDKLVFNQYLDQCESLSNRLDMLKKNRNQGFASLLKRNSVLAKLTFTQRTHLQSMLKKQTLKESDCELLWSKGDCAGSAHVIIVAEGQLAVHDLESGGEEGAAAHTGPLGHTTNLNDKLNRRLLRRGSCHVKPRILPTQMEDDENPLLLAGTLIIPGIIAQSADRQSKTIEANDDAASIRSRDSGISSGVTDDEGIVEYSVKVNSPEVVVYTCAKAEFRKYLDEYPSVLLMLLKAGSGIITCSPAAVPEHDVRRLSSSSSSSMSSPPPDSFSARFCFLLPALNDSAKRACVA